MTTGKTIALTIQTFVSKVMSLLFNTLSRFVRAFLPRSKCLSILWLQSPSAVILEPKKIKSVAASTFPPVSPRMKWWNWIRTPAKTLSAYNTWISRCWQFESVSCKYKLVLLSNRCLGHLFTWLAGRLSAFYWSKQNLGFLPHPIPSHPFWPSPNAQKAHSNLSLKPDFAFSVQLGSERCRSSQLQQWPDGQLPYPLLSPALVL